MVQDITALPVHASQRVTWYDCNMTDAAQYVSTVLDVDQRDTEIAYCYFTTKVTVCESSATFTCALTPKTRLLVEIPIQDGNIVMDNVYSRFYSSDMKIEIRDHVPASQNDHDLYIDIVEQVILAMTLVLEQLRPLQNEIDFFVKCVDLMIHEDISIRLCVESLQDASVQVRVAYIKAHELFFE